MNIHNGFAIVLVLGIIAFSQVSGALAANILVGMDIYSVLNSYEYLSVLDNYYLVMQPDCDLILYNQSGLPLKHTDSSRALADGSLVNLNCSLWMQSDGNCVIYNLTSAGWINATSNAQLYIPWAESGLHNPQWNASFLLLGGDGSLDFYTPNATRRQEKYTNLTVVDVNEGSPVMYPKFDLRGNSTYKAWVPGVSLDEYPYMPAGYFLSPGKKLRTLSSPGFSLELNASNCSLQSQQFLYEGGTLSLWNSNTTASLQNRPCQLELLQNGTLQVRDLNSNETYWRSGTSGDNTVSWILKLDPDDGTLSVSDITNSSNLLWTNAGNSQSPQSNPKSTSDRSIVWIVVGVIVGAFLLAMAALGLYFCARERFLDSADRAFQKRLRAIGGHSQALSQAKIKKATNNYQTVIGRGGFGDVFYGQLPDGQEVAAKVLSMNSHQSKQEFYNEIELLSKVHHKYLVSLLGYSSTRSHQVLIYEYMGRGDLRYRLQQGKSETEVPLSWRERTNIMLQVAEGLEYLHEKCSPPIIHRDIKSTNILLTSKLVAKVADFGLSKLKAIGQEDATHVTTVVKGTPGYLDPEYHETGLLTEKSDVYAFGVVLMEILTGQHHMLIANRVGEAWRQQQFQGLADPRLGDDFDRSELASLVELALWCVRWSSVERPFMRQVVRRLHGLLLVPSEASEPNIDLAEELNIGRHAPEDIELMTMDSSRLSFSSESIPLNTESSSSAVSLEVHRHSEQIQSHSQHRRYGTTLS
ncbi:hypothetical protein M758_3G226100 [Ceratodon purpureus]|nr:hypothetical protein M758_3G226100 [Ceratodon purpureus]